MSVLSYIDTIETGVNSFWSRTECRIILPMFRVFCIAFKVDLFCGALSEGCVQLGGV